jgi:dTDP-4-amino-4,6-dideoxygalactose transaminase
VKRINVAEPFLPPLEEYVDYLAGIWERNWLTNQGPLVEEFEKKIQDYHGLSTSVHCLANGSLGLQIALKALGVKGEVITTPFSYVATTSCPLWEGCTVKFADIEPDYLTIDPQAVEAAISSKTEAILATHVFGNPCDVEALESIAKKHGLALIYDAAHAFGVTYNGKSILEYGDVSMVSLHATKLMHSVEGGFVVAKDPAVRTKVEWMRRFGHDGYDAYHGVGINAKMSDFHAAMGLCILKHFESISNSRRLLSEAYSAGLPDGIFAFRARPGATANYSYYPVLFESESILLEAMRLLSDCNIYARRYFHPLLHRVEELQPASFECSVAESVASRVLCLPMMAIDDVERFAELTLINLNAVSS